MRGRVSFFGGLNHLSRNALLRGIENFFYIPLLFFFFPALLHFGSSFLGLNF